jgi:hypothetical protein
MTCSKSAARSSTRQGPEAVPVREGLHQAPETVRIGEKVHSYWTRTPEKFFSKTGDQDNEAIKDWLDPL